MMLIFLLLQGTGMAQVRIYGSSPFQDSLWAVDTTSLQVVHRVAPSLAGFTITGMNGMAYDPVNHEAYIIMKLSGVTGRVLGKIDLSTGVCTQVGNLGDNFSSIAFRADGQLFGVTGDGATVPETLYLIDKSNGSKTVATALGNGADGEIIAYNHQDDHFYHWSGNGTVVFEKISAQAPYTVTTINANAAVGETFGSLYLGNGNFYTANINSQFRHFNISGAVSANFATLPDDLRGLVIAPNFVFNEDSVCQRVEDLTVAFSGILHDTVKYAWGDGTTDIVFPAASATHTYSSAGLKTVRVILNNPYLTAPDTFLTYQVQVVNSPNVAVNTPQTAICDGNPITLTGSTGGQSQWYQNGVAIPGANSPSYSASTGGIYNLLKTNQNGCSDSAATGILLLEGTTPAPFSLGPDSTVCVGASACFGPAPVAGLIYTWSSGDSTSVACLGTAGTYVLEVSDSAGCATSDTLEVFTLALPSPVLGIDTTNCPDIAFTITDSTGTVWNWSFGDGSTANTTTPVSSHLYALNGTYNIVYTASNACGSTTDSTQLSITCVLDAVDHALAGRVTVYPNPFEGQLNILLDLPAIEEVSLELRDLSGKLIQSEQHEGMVQIIEFKPDANLSQGVYLLTVKTMEGNATIRIMK